VEETGENIKMGKTFREKVLTIHGLLAIVMKSMKRGRCGCDRMVV
jgi:hypothetical protein